MSVEAKERLCAFVRDWKCHVEAEDIPLDVCRMCLDARRLHIEELGRVVKRTGVAMPSLQPQIQLAPIQGGRGAMEELSHIDDLFMKGELSFQDYLAKRKEAMKHLL